MAIMDVEVLPPVAAKDSIYEASEDAILIENRTLRQQLIKLLVINEAGQVQVPKSTSEKLLLDRLLNGVDKEVTTRAKLRIASKSSDELGNLAGAVAKALRSHNVNKSRVAHPSERVLPADIKVYDPIPGEMDIGTKTFSVEEITG